MKNITIEKEDIEYLKAYHELQYERIDKLEGQRFNFANLILTLSTFALTFGYKDASIQLENGVQKAIYHSSAFNRIKYCCNNLH